MSSNKSSILLGLIILLFGITLLLSNLGMDIDLGEIISTYWPVLLIAWGIDNLIPQREKTNGRNLLVPLIVLFLGVLILGRNLGYYYFDLSLFWRLFWPLVLILAGFNILRGAVKTGSTGWAVMSGIEQKNRGWQLRDKSYIAFMGGIELDLTRADIPTGETFLDLTAVMGGIDIFVPDDIDITCSGTGLLGGIEFLQESSGGVLFNKNFEYKTAGTDKKIIINCRAFMGGIEIKNAKKN